MESRPMGKLSPTGAGSGASTAGAGTLSKERKKRERWLLTRKTWRYMADAGRRLVPEGHNRPEDLPKIEEYFQEACAREPGFLLWRKQSYPGALGFRRTRSKSAAKKRSSCRGERERAARSADEADEPRIEEEPELSPRLRAEKLRREFLFGKSDARDSPGGAGSGAGEGAGSAGRSGAAGAGYEAGDRDYGSAALRSGAGAEYGDPGPGPGPEDPGGRVLLDALHGYLYRGGLDTEALLRRLREHLAEIEKTQSRRPSSFIPAATGSSVRAAGGRDRDRDRDRDLADRSLLATLSRHFGKTPDRQRMVSDLLTDRKKLERLYFELRQTRGFSGGRRGYPGSSAGRRGTEYREGEEEYDTEWTPLGSPPLIEIESDPSTSHATQTDSIAPHSWVALAEESKKLRAAREAKEEQEGCKSPPPGANPRRSSVDHDDVSPSVSDTIKRYLRMARKKSVDSDKADRFKRVNYDRNLRNIKPKGEITSVGDDDGLDKGAQTEESWVEALRSLKIDSPEVESAVNSSRSSLTEEPVSPVSPTSKTFLSSGQTFLSNLLHGLQDKTVSTGGMQKSKSSTSVVQGSRLVAKKIWKSRSKSQSRATPSATSAWTPQGRCVWSNVAGRSVSLSDTSLPQLTEIERRVLQKVALAKLQALNLGVNIKIPSESSTPAAVQKPKRRAYLLKRKAITTSVFDTSRKDEKDKEAATGMVFGVPLGQCVENERARMCPRIEAEDLDLRRKSHHGSRGSFSSLIETPRPDEGGSCESLISPTLSMPGLDNISCGSTQNLVTSEGGVPNVVVSCLRHLENHGLHTLGIFRVSSSKKRVRQLREEFDCGKEINLENDLCPHDVATLLKEYFRDLPDPLLCKDLYQAFIQTQKIRNRRLQHEALQHLLQLLPVANRDTLWSLLNTLSLVAVNSNDQKNNSGEWILGNKMDSSNLATLFAPNLLHSCSKPMSAKDELSAERAEERSDAINVIRCLIDNYKTLFQVSAELLDEVYLHMMDSHPEALDQLLRRRDTSVDELDDSISGACDEVERKVWSRESCTHETAGMGGPDVDMRPRRPERGRERLSRKRREEVSRKRLESESSSRRTSSTDDKTRMSSSDSGRLTPDESNTSDGVITASLKIPVPPVTSFSLNLDDIPFIEDSDKQHITLGLLKSSSSQHVTSESGFGSFSPPTRPPSVTSWGSTPTSPECEPTTAIISFPPKQQAVLQKVTIKSTGEIHQVQPSYSRSESYNAERRSYQQHLLTTEKISKSASTSTVPLRESERVVSSQEPSERSERAVITPSISSIGGAVLRSKTADIERMLRIQSKTKKPAVSSVSIEKEFKRRYADTRHLTRHLQSEDRGETSSTSSSRVESRSIWKRHELISSEPKERRSFF